MQYLSMPTKYETANYSENLVKCRIRVMHDKENFNGSSFSLESINKAKESLKNIPILAYIKENINGDKDFDEHNVDISLDFDGEEITIKEKYLETPIGVIPSENNYALETIDGKTYVSVDGYIWKNYSNEAFDILLEAGEKEVSMEIKVNEGKFSDGYYQIEDYTYLGVTVLGSDVKGAMGEHCKISMNFSTDNKEFFKAIEDLNKEIKSQLEGEVQTVENIETVVTETVEEIATTNEVVEEVQEVVTEETVEANAEEVVEEEFAKKKKIADDSLITADEEVSEDKEETIIEEVEKEQPTIIEKTVIPAKAEPIQEQSTANEEEVVEETVVEEVTEETTENFSINKEEYDKLVNELEELRKFKANILHNERVKEINNIASEFSFEEEEISEIKEKAIKEELTLEQFKKELFALEGMKAYANRQKFSANKEETAKIVVTNIQKFSDEPYGGLFTKYNNNK